MHARILFAVLTAFVAATAYAAGPQAVAVHTFACPGNCSNGAIPKSITQGSDGNFYGVAQQSTSTVPDEGGVVYSLTPAGAFTNLYKFVPGKDKNYLNGSNPGLIVEGADGKLYGTTYFGGTDNDGTVFRLNRDGSGFQSLHSFCGFACGDIAPFEPLVVAGDGNVYGSESNGGDVSCGYFGRCGAIFRVTAATGAYEIVVNFNFETTGLNPTNLVVGSNGTLYATTEGSSGPLLVHYDEVAGTVEASALALPSGITDSFPSALVLGPNGNLYGMYTFVSDDGTQVTGVFEVHPDGSNLHIFPAIANFPLATSDGFVVGSDGNLWMAQYQAQSGWGDILTISPKDGTLVQTLSPFSEKSAVGADPFDLISGSDGKLWGVSTLFGQVPKGSGAGVVFNLTP